MGRGIHNDRARVKARIGAKINKVFDDEVGRMGSFVNNFTASAIG